jgi:hypothetical protein
VPLFIVSTNQNYVLPILCGKNSKLPECGMCTCPAYPGTVRAYAQWFCCFFFTVLLTVFTGRRWKLNNPHIELNHQIPCCYLIIEAVSECHVVDRI